jgi:4-alpha-glucanotransferase
VSIPATRSAGILLHPTSLPGPFGIGDFGPWVDRFLDWAKSAGQTLWQVLPLTTLGGGGSPYGGASAFAGNPLLLSPELLLRDGFLPVAAFEDLPEFPKDRVDFDAVIHWKERILRQSWEHFASHAGEPAREELRAFREAPARKTWLEDWTLFSALKARFSGRAWTSWDSDLRRRDPEALERASGELETEVSYQAYLQFLFFRQWERVHHAARERGITVMGDVPIYVSFDSADVWANPELFELDAEGMPTSVSGVPPDYFSETGQLWGNPLYAWDHLAETGYAWWVERIRANLALCDLLRIDHFRAFSAYWSVPAGDPTALNGKWVPGPGAKLFDAVRTAIGGDAPLPIVAEDLGDIDDDVKALLAGLGLPGMKVLQFAFYGADSEYLPHRHTPNALVYTGTHDNDTARGWYAALKPEERERVFDYLGSDGSEIHWALIRGAYGSVAQRAIVPMQDVLGLGSEARMNTPADPGGNWTWRAPDWALRPEDAARLKRMAILSGRFPSDEPRHS